MKEGKHINCFCQLNCFCGLHEENEGDKMEKAIQASKHQ